MAQRQYPKPEHSPTDHPEVAIEQPTDTEKPPVNDVVIDRSETAPIVPKPVVSETVRHRQGQRPVLSIIHELLAELDSHPDAKVLMAARGGTPRVAPGVPDASQGFEDTPINSQYLLEIKIAYRDTVTRSAEAPVTDGLTPFQRKWGQVIKEPEKLPPAPSPRPFAYAHLVQPKG